MQYRNVMIGRTSCERLCLVFDPSKSPHYKVIRFMTKGQARPGREYIIDVYESETHTWNNWGKRHVTNWRFNNAVYWNGGMYFIRPGGNSYCFYLQEIAGVDERIDRPPWTCYKGMRHNYAMESNGHLHSISLSVRPDKNYLSIFEMNKEDRSWFMKYRADINPIAHLFAVKFPVFGSVLGIVRGDREEDSTFLFHEPGKIILYRFHEESFEGEMYLRMAYGSVGVDGWAYGSSEGLEFGDGGDGWAYGGVDGVRIRWRMRSTETEMRSGMGLARGGGGVGREIVGVVV
ncbi:hypothetical protein BUALT_Bualt12G0054900 [Buddleja alternifolia]|uniref:F-box associated domain-containing protein n=1 Tax=Buddleja alternifolia TaxID=168488 RepID=A0AAV6WZH4_9LAMI|nr:hypothetical protein BUALT_Bualt12G0054900 [Buddleja alternifolia]